MRRQRAKARLKWYLHHRGLVRLAPQQLQALYNQLAAHHSRDPGFLKRVRRDLLQATMAYWAPWTCLCGRHNGKSAAFCAACGQPWDPTYLAQATPRETDQGPWPDTDGWSQRPGDQSPRRRPPSRRRPGQGRGNQPARQGNQPAKGNGKGKGSGAGVTGKGRIPPPPPPGGPPNEPTWTPPTTAAPLVTAPQAAAPTREQTQAELALQSLMTVLRRNTEQLTPELHEAMQSVTSQEQKNSGKQLHSAVTRWSKAQTNHLEAVRARAQLHSAWSGFVTQAIQRWEQYAQEFAQQDTDLQTSITNTKSTLDTAKQELATLKTQITGASAATEESTASDNTMAVDQQANRLEAQSANIQEGLTTMVNQLRGVRKRTEHVIDLEDEPAVTRQRTDETEPAKGIQRFRFSTGRCVGLLQIAHQWPNFPWPCFSGLGWHHSICQVDDFKTTWQADFDGLCAAFDLGFVDKQPTVPYSSYLATFREATSAKTVGFLDEVEVLFYDEPVAASFSIDHNALCSWHSKPWSLHGGCLHSDPVPLDRAEDTPVPRAPGFEWVQIGTEQFDVPPLHLQLNWIQQLWPAFVAQAREFQRGAGPVCFLRTWFLDDDRNRRCNHWRELRLVPYYDFWQQDLLQLWQDQIRDRSTVEIFLVDPPVPLIPGMEYHIGDLFVVQSPQPHRRAVLVSTSIQLPFEDRRSLLALSVPRQQPRHELLRLAQLMFHSWHHSCRIQRGFRILHDGLIAHVQASGLHITIEPVDDDTSLMQTTNIAGNAEHRQLNSVVQLPLRPPHWESDVFGLWIQQGTILCEDEGPTVPLHTWFIHHDHHRIGFAPRTWNVVAPMATWERQLRGLWHDFVDPHESLEFAFVHPSPEDAHGPHGHGHLILSQGGSEYAAIIITAIYEQWHTPALAQAAFSSPRNVDGHYLLRLIGAARPCEDVQCSLWSRPTQIAIDDAISLQDGMSFEVDIPRSLQTDETSLLHLQPSQQLRARRPAAAPCLYKLSPPQPFQCGTRKAADLHGNWLCQPSCSGAAHSQEDSECAFFMQVSHNSPITLKDEPAQPDWQQTMHHHLGNPADQPVDPGTPSDPDDDPSNSEHGGSDHEDDPPNSPGSSRPMRPPPDDPTRQSVLLLQCGRAPIHAYIAWHDHDAMLQEIANHCLVPIHRVMYLYDLQFRPFDLQTDIYPMIVHMDFDLDPGSFEQLCLVDVERHGQPHQAHYFTAPLVTRRVMKVPHQLVRNTLLRLIAADTYCASVAQRCIVHHNGDNWNLQDPQLRSVSHGAHFRIILPPDERCPHSDILNAWQGVNHPHSGNASDGYSPSVLPSESSDSFDLDQLLESDEHASLHTALGFSRKAVSDVTLPSPDMVASNHADIAVSPTLPFALSTIEDSQWLSELVELFPNPWTSGCVGDNILPVQTWYLNHQNQLRCHLGRPLELQGPPSDWRRQILAVWHDVIDPAHLCNIELVQPNPPAIGPIFAAHLIVSQHRVPVALFADSHVEVVATVIFDQTPSAPLRHLALVMPAWSLSDDFFFVLQLLPLCQQRRSQGLHCTIQHGPNIFELGLRDLFHNGDSLIARVPAAPASSSDAVTFLQVHSSKVFKSPATSQDPANPVHDSSYCHIQFVHGECLSAQPLVVQQLATLLHFTIKGLSSPTRTWFVDLQHPSLIPAARPIEFQLDSNTWISTLRDAWQDFLANQAFELSLAFDDHGGLLGILIISHSFVLPEHRVVLFKTEDSPHYHPCVVRHSITNGEVIGHARRLHLRQLPPRDDSCSILLNGHTTRTQHLLVNHADRIQITLVQENSREDSPPTTLSLCQLLPQSQQLRIQVDKLDFLINQIHQHRYQVHFVRNGPAWHPATTQALHTTADWQQEEVLGCHFYTDGSFRHDSQTATASAVLLLVTSHGFRWGGFLATNCLGTPTSQRAEATAIFLATSWMIDLKLKYMGELRNTSHVSSTLTT